MPSIDLEDVSGIDDWLTRLRDAGFLVHASSGTSGKASFLPVAEADVAFHRGAMTRGISWMTGLSPGARRPAFLLGPAQGHHRLATGLRVLADGFCDPDATMFLMPREAGLDELARMGVLRAWMQDGTITPAELAEIDRDGARRRDESNESFERITTGVLDRVHEPIIIRGIAPLVMRLVERLRVAGMADGSFHPETVVIYEGGGKGLELPDDFREQLAAFFAGSRITTFYGMSELNAPLGRCSARRWHVPASIVPLVLDESGEAVLGPEAGDVVGRLALFDCSVAGRWGGIITSDQVQGHADACPCGLPAFSISAVSRYGSAAGDDKLTCAGTIAAYLRGVADER